MKYLWLLLFSAVLTTTAAQDSTQEVSLKTGTYLKSYFTNGVQLAVSPLHWKQKDWLLAGGIVVAGTSLYLADGEINKPFMRWQSPGARTFGKVGKALGPVPLVGGSLLLLGYGAVARLPALTNFAQDNLQAQLYTGGICFLTKGILGRRRVGDQPHYWAGPFQFSNDDYQSFFSGHASVAFATATSIYLHSHKKWWVGIISYTAATGIAVSRMQRQNHWASDVFVGAAVGTAVSSFVYHQAQKKRNVVKLKQLP